MSVVFSERVNIHTLWTFTLANCAEEETADYIHAKKGILNKEHLDYTVADFVDYRGNSILWYLTYRDDQQAEGGFACPRIERELLRLGADPNRRNNLGLCWNVVRRHVIRPEM